MFVALRSVTNYMALILFQFKISKVNLYFLQVKSLMDKLQAYEQGASGVTGLTPDDRAASHSDLVALNFQQRVEDMLSTGRGGNVSGGVEAKLNLVDLGGESLLPESYHCAGLVDTGIHSEDDMSDEGCSQYPVGLLADDWWSWNS